MEARGAEVETSLTLPPDPRSPSAARALVRRVLGAAGREDWLDAAELAVSELVTNAALHAHTPLTVTVRVSQDELYVEVLDRNPVLPVPRGYDRRATTGRGLGMVAVLSRDCGVVSLGAAGKRVWFTVGDEPSRDVDAEEDLLAAWAEDPWDEPVASSPLSTAAGTPLRTVRLLGLPPNLWLAARQHHDALLRELVLYLAEHPGPQVDTAGVDAARGHVTEAVVAAVHRATGGGGAPTSVNGRPAGLAWVSDPLDLSVLLSPDLSPAYTALREALDLAERLALEARLLVRPGLPELVALREWVLGQVVAQLDGAEPTRWAGVAQAHFETEVRSRLDDATSWDLALVRDSPRGAVAVDESNQIVAVSRPLASALGWQVADLVGRRAVTLVPPELREAHVAGFSRHLSTGETKILGKPLTLPVLRADGTRLPCHFLLEEEPTGLGHPLFVAWIDPVRPG